MSADAFADLATIYDVGCGGEVPSTLSMCLLIFKYIISYIFIFYLLIYVKIKKCNTKHE